MQGGFTFCGADIERFGLVYAPELSDSYPWLQGQVSVQDENNKTMDGGFYYGYTSQPKDMTLRCFFEDNFINSGLLHKISQFFAPGRTGKLVFQKREWVYYTATVVSPIDTRKITNAYNGLIEIHLRAYYPYGRCDIEYLPDGASYYEDMRSNSCILPYLYTPERNIVGIGGKNESLTEETSFYLYNGGTAMAKTAIQIAGDIGEGVDIINETTGQTCSFVGFNNATTTEAGKYVTCDGLNGRTVLTDGVLSESAFLYHSGGFIELAPSRSFVRGASLTAQEGTKNVVSASSIFDSQMVGEYILGGTKQYRITNFINEGLIEAENAEDVSGSKYFIAQLNKITVRPKSEMNLTKLNFVYQHTFM